MTYSDFEGVTWPGTANTSTDPLWHDAANGDYRLNSGSPCRSSGADGRDIGASVPVGAPMAPSQPSITSATVENGEIVLRFWADYARTYTLQSSSTLAGPWTKVTDYSPAIPTFVETRQAASANRFFRLVSPKQ